MTSDKTDLSESCSIGTRLEVDPHSDGIPSLDGHWHWEIVSETSGQLFVRVEGHIAECKTLRFFAKLTPADAKRLAIWLTSKIPGIKEGGG